MTPVRFSPMTALLASLACVAMPAAWAAGTVELEVRAGKDQARMSIEWLDNQRLRMDMASAGMPAHIKSWQVLRDGKVYAVTVSNGQTMVMELGGTMKMMSGMLSAQSLKGREALGDVEEFHGLQATGRHESVAGVSGEVFMLDYRPSEGKRQQVEVVLSKQRTVRELTEAMMNYGKVMSTAMGHTDAAGSDRMQAEFDQRGMGLLRFGDQLKAVRVSSKAPATQRLELPAAPVSLPQIPGMPGMAGMGEGKAPAGGAAQRQVDRQQGRVAERAQAETDTAVDKVVDDAIGKALGKLLGR